MKKSDIVIGLIIGELIALLSFSIFKNFGLKAVWVYYVWPVFLPIFCSFCLWIAYLLGKKFTVIWQVAKFILVGVLNTVVDLGIFNLFILISDISSGTLVIVFKGISGFIAVVHSYFWNKLWTFQRKGSGKTGKEFLQFGIVSLIGFGINLGVASLVINIIGPQFDIAEKIWANIGAFTATLVTMTWNFLGYKFFVFK